MPASKDYTLIKVMRGNLGSSELCTPEEGELLLDTDTRTLRFGDSDTKGGIQINTATTSVIETPVDLNEQRNWGRFYFSGNVLNLPAELGETGKFFLTVHSSGAGKPEVMQTIQVLDGNFKQRSYQRSSVDYGNTWTQWKDLFLSFENYGTGTKENERDLNKYVYTTSVFVEGIINGPEKANGGSGFLYVTRRNLTSKYIFQKLMLVTPSSSSGKIFVRFSASSNSNWESPGYNWREVLIGN